MGFEVLNGFYQRFSVSFFVVRFDIVAIHKGVTNSFPYHQCNVLLVFLHCFFKVLSGLPVIVRWAK